MFRKISTKEMKLLRGDAFQWFKPIMKDFLEDNRTEDRKTEINRLFEDLLNFEQPIRRTDGDIDTECTAERRLF